MPARSIGAPTSPHDTSAPRRPPRRSGVTALIVAGPSGLSEHDGGPRHPEHPSRLVAVMAGVRTVAAEHEVVSLAFHDASMDELARAHDPGYLAELEAFCAEGGGDIDADTYARPDSWTAARRGAGAGLAALDELERGGEGVAFVPVRPPGHHATANRAMGFCLVNNVAVAAASRTALGERVLIVDWDVHHGNGTQAIFWDDPDVLYVSTHQHPLYPGTGRADEVGGPAAAGRTLNFPLPPGATGDVVRGRARRGGPPGDRGVPPRLGAGLVRIRRPPGRPAQRPPALERGLRRAGPCRQRVRAAARTAGPLPRRRVRRRCPRILGGGDARRAVGWARPSACTDRGRPGSRPAARRPVDASTCDRERALRGGALTPARPVVPVRV